MRTVMSFALLLLLCGKAFAVAAPEISKFNIMREGHQIGSSTTSIQSNGKETVVDTTINVDVKILGFTAYRYVQTSNEKWAGDHVVTITSETDDNGTKHNLSLALHDDKLIGEADGKVLTLDAGMIPSSVWNPKLVTQTVVMDSVNGKLKHISVTDLGTENIDIRGQPTKAHHYSMRGQLEQDLWYDMSGRLVQLKFKGRDGSVISYHLM
jgi:hypothetical protein